MKRTISTLAILSTLALPAKAGETGPSKADLFNSLLVVGIYTRRCATRLSEPVKARIRTVTRLLGDVDSALLEYSITAYTDVLAGTDLESWCRETGEALREGSK
jgi:hypothetical protein